MPIASSSPKTTVRAAPTGQARTTALSPAPGQIRDHTPKDRPDAPLVATVLLDSGCPPDLLVAEVAVVVIRAQREPVC
jgi:hypothetical protein